MVLLVTLLSGMGVALVMVGAYQHLDTAVGVIEQRLGRYAGVSPGQEIRDQISRKGTSLTTTVNSFVDRQSFADRLRADLQRADLKLTAGEYVVMRVCALLIGFAVGYVLFGGLIPGLLVSVLFYFIPRLWLKRRMKARERRFGELLGEAILMMASSLRAGYSMMQALETISKEMASPISDEFHRVTLEVGVGISVEEALSHLVQRIKSADLELMTIAMNVQREVGGNLAEILDTIAATIRERQQLQGEVRTLTAQGRISAYIITALPVGLGLVLYLLNRSYMSVLWTTPVGFVMLGAAVIMTVVGFFVTRKVAQVEV